MCQFKARCPSSLILIPLWLRGNWSLWSLSSGSIWEYLPCEYDPSFLLLCSCSGDLCPSPSVWTSPSRCEGSWRSFGGDAWFYHPVWHPTACFQSLCLGLSYFTGAHVDHCHLLGPSVFWEAADSWHPWVLSNLNDSVITFSSVQGEHLPKQEGSSPTRLDSPPCR